MTEDRERQLVSAIKCLPSTSQIEGFAEQLDLQGEHVGVVKATLEKRKAELAEREGRR